MGTHRLPATLDEFLLLLGPRGPPRPRPIVKEMSADFKEEKRDTSSSSGKRWASIINIATITITINIAITITIILMKRWTDAEWPQQWYLNRGGALDMNVEAAWDKGGSSSSSSSS